MIGRRRRHPEDINCILQLIRTTSPDEQDQSDDPRDASTDSSKDVVTITREHGLKMTIRSEWVCEHAVQIARILPGGLEILGVYVLCDPLVFDGKLLGTLLTQLNSQPIPTLERRDADVLIQVDYGRIRAHQVSSGRLCSSQVQNSDCLHDLVEVRTTYDVSNALCDDEIAHPSKDTASSFDVVEEAIRSEVRGRAQQCRFSNLISGQSMGELVRYHIKRGGLDHVPVVLSGPVMTGKRATLDCRAFVFEDERLEDALDAMKTDIELTLRARMDILKDVQDILDASTSKLTPSMAPSTSRPSMTAWLSWPQVPSRAFFGWKRGGGAYCDYIFPGEGAHEVLQRLRRLVGPYMVDARRFSAAERAPSLPTPAAPAKHASSLGALLMKCNVMLLGTIACALIAILSYL